MVRKFSPQILFLMETKAFLDKLALLLGFANVSTANVEGYLWGLVLFWDSDVNLTVCRVS